MIHSTFSYLKYVLVLPSLVGLLSFTCSYILPVGINGDFIGGHNQQCSVCTHPIQFSLSNSDSTASDLMVVSFKGDSDKPDRIEITGVDGGTVSRTERNEVAMRLAAGEYATISLKVHFTADQQHVTSFINGAKADAINVSFGVQTQEACR